MSDWYVEGQLTKFRTGSRGRHHEDAEGMRMRPIAMTLRTEADVADVAAYVASLEPTSPAAALDAYVDSVKTAHPDSTLEHGNADRGKGRYAVCIQCHGADGRGNVEKDAPGLVGKSDWYLKAQIEKFQDGRRGAQEPPTSNAGMMARVWSKTLTDEQAILDALAYIQTLN